MGVQKTQGRMQVMNRSDIRFWKGQHFTSVALLISALLLAALLQSKHLYAQTTMVEWPTLSQSATACSGVRMAKISRDKNSTDRIYIRLIAWNGAIAVRNSFVVERLDGSQWVGVTGDKAAALEAKLNKQTDYDDSNTSEWEVLVGNSTYTQSSTTPPGQLVAPSARYVLDVTDWLTEGETYRIRNKENVFHLGIAKANSVPSKFEYTSNASILPPGNKLELKYRETDGTFQPFPLVAGKPTVTICKRGDLEISANDGLEDFFHYTWKPGGKISAPNNVATVKLRDVMNNISNFTVKREGVCGVDVTATFAVNVIEPLAPILELTGGPGFASGHVCETEQLTVTVKNIPGAEKLEYGVKESGKPDYGLQDGVVNPITPTPTTTSSVTLPGTFTFRYYSHDPNLTANEDPITHELRVIVSNGQCFASRTLPVTVYPGVQKPQVVVTTPNSTTNCSPLNIFFKDQAVQRRGVIYDWKLGEAPFPTTYSNQTMPTVTARNQGTSQQYFHSSVTVSDKSGNCKATASTHPVPPAATPDYQATPVNPELTPTFTIKHEFPATPSIPNVPPSCTPQKLTLEDFTPGATSRQWILRAPAENGLPALPDQVWNPNAGPTKYVNNNFVVDKKRTYFIIMDVTNGFCPARKSSLFAAYPPPKSDPLLFTPLTNQCWPYKFKLTADHLENVASVHWRVDKGGKKGVASPQIGSVSISTGVNKWEQEFEFKNEEDHAVTWKVYVTLFSIGDNCPKEMVYDVKISERINLVLENDDPEGCPDDNLGNRRVIVRNKSQISPTHILSWTLDGASYNPTPVVAGARDKFYVDLRNQSTTTTIYPILKLGVSALGGGCTQEVDLKFTLHPRVDPDFFVEYPHPASGAATTFVPDTKLCPDINATLKATVAGMSRYEWKIQHPNLENPASPQQEYNGEGKDYNFVFKNPIKDELTYKVTLKAINAAKCSQQLSKNYILRPGIKAEFTVKKLDECTPYRIQLIDQTKTKVPYNAVWDLDGGVLEAGAKDIYSYSVPGNKRVKITATTQTGGTPECVSVSAPFDFEVLPPVVASIQSVTPSDKVCAPQELTFTNGSTNAEQNKWEFETGLSEILQTASDIKYHYKNTEAAPRNVQVVLRAYNKRGCKAEDRRTLIIYPEPRPINSYEIKDKCHPFKLEFLSESPSLQKYTWTFTPTGTGAAGGATVVKTGNQDNNPVEVTLANTSQHDFIKYKITYEGSKDWGTGVVCATPTLQLGEVLVPPKLTADIKVRPRLDGLDREICSEESPVEFDVVAKGGTNIAHHWDFDDGGNIFVSKNQNLVSHTFVNKTFDDVTRKVKIATFQNETLCRVDNEIEIVVHPEVLAQFTKTDGDICQTPRPANIINNSRGNVGGLAAGVTRYFEWDYGYPGGQETRNDVGAHTWLFPNDAPNTNATMNITLNAREVYRSGKVCKSAQPATSSILVAPKLKPEFVADKTIDCIPFSVSFTNSSTGAPRLRYIWDYADGSTSSESNANHSHHYGNLSLTAKTDYNVALTIENEETRCTATKTLPITACPKVTADFSVDNTAFCTPSKLVVHNHSRNAMKYNWSLLGSAGASIPFTTDLNDVLIDLVNSTGSDKQVTLQLIASAQYTSGLTCEDTKESNITLHPEIIPDFDFDEAVGCSPMNVKINNKSRGAIKFRWYIDDIENPMLQQQRDPQFELTNYSVEGVKRVYKVRMVASNGDCSAELTKEVTVYPQIKSKIILSKYNGCTPLTLEAEAGEQKESYSYQWSAVQGTVALPTLAKSEATFNNAAVSPSVILQGTINLKVYFTDAPQCFHESSQQVSIYPGVYPDFVAPQPGCAPYDARFQINTNVFSSDATEYTWSVDGNQVLKVKSLSPENPTIRLINNDNIDIAKRQVTLHVRSVHGCEAEVTRPVTVYPKPKALFQVNGKSEGCPPFDVEFLNFSKGENLKFSYDYGDGSSVTVLHAGAVQKQYTHQDDTDKIYNVVLTAESDKGCTDQQTSVITVYPQAHADFDITPNDKGCSPLAVKFENRSNAPVSKIFYWNFGDGTVPHEMNEPEHLFENLTTQDVVYTTTLVAKTDHGCEAKAEKMLTVYATPKARMAITPLLQVFPNSTINLTNLSTPAPSDWDYSWNFGDGASATEKDPISHKYAQWGLKAADFAYDVNLTVKSPKCTSETMVKAYVLPPYPDPAFSAFAYEGCVPFRLALLRDKNLMTPDETYLWDFGDGETSTEKVPIHDYKKVGTYHVKLTVTGDGGVNYAFAVVTVLPNPVVKFSLYPEQVMLPKATIKGQNLTQGDNLTFLWNFGDGGYSNERSPQHDYTTPGKFLVTCTAINTQLKDCQAQDTVTVVVRPEGSLIFPNVFQPSDNGSNGGVYDENDRLNEVFHPYGEGVADYTLRVYDRWGELIFESNDIKRGWDGYWNGRLCETGVYTWRALGHFFNGEVYDLRGNVTLLRK